MKGLGQKTTSGIVIELIQKTMGDADWKVKSAGQYLFAESTEIVKDAYKKSLDDCLKLSASAMTDANAIVRYSGFTSMGYVLEEFAPKPQIKFHADIMPQLMTSMKTEPSLKLKA